MIRIAGTLLPNKRLEIALTYIYGIGHTTSLEILGKAKIDPNKKIDKLTEKEENLLRTIVVEEYTTEGDLRRQVQENITRLKRIKSYRGYRHSRNLPVRGQRTKTNARTRKPQKRTVANKKG